MPEARVLQRHRLVEVQLAEQPAGYYPPPLGREQQVPHLAEHRLVSAVGLPEACCQAFPLAAWTRTVSHLVAAVSVGNPAMWVASGSTAVAGFVDGAGTVAADWAGTGWVPHSIDSAFRELQEDRPGHRVDR